MVPMNNLGDFFCQFSRERADGLLTIQQEKLTHKVVGGCGIVSKRRCPG